VLRGTLPQLVCDESVRECAGVAAAGVTDDRLPQAATALDVNMRKPRAFPCTKQAGMEIVAWTVDSLVFRTPTYNRHWHLHRGQLRLANTLTDQATQAPSVTTSPRSY
jgi:hypothetical protein